MLEIYQSTIHTQRKRTYSNGENGSQQKGFNSPKEGDKDQSQTLSQEYLLESGLHDKAHMLLM